MSCLRLLCFLIACLGGIPSTALAQLGAGPMPGPAQMREVRIWLQTTESALCALKFWPEHQPQATRISESILTQPESAYCATFTLADLEPGTRYRYQLSLNGAFAAPVYAFQTLAPPTSASNRSWKLGLVSGHHRPTTEEEDVVPTSIYKSLLAQRPDALFWLGDTPRLLPGDTESPSGLRHRYSHNRQSSELQPLLASTHHYAVWSPDSYGPPQAGRLFQDRLLAMDTFGQFWPQRLTQFPGGIARSFRFEDVEFFFLDVQWWRDGVQARTARASLLGETQISWLLDALQRSEATFKILVSGLPLLNPSEGDPDLYSAWNDERKTLLDALTRIPVDGMLVLSGGRPFGEMTKLVSGTQYPLHELSMGPFTDRPLAREAHTELNYFRVPGTLTFVNQFALLHFQGTADDRSIRVEMRNSSGESVWAHTLKASDLVHPIQENERFRPF